LPEIERKFKVESPSEDVRGPGAEICQGYLSVELIEIRLRARDDARELTVKSLGGLRRVEVALPLTPQQFEELWPLVISLRRVSRATSWSSAARSPRWTSTGESSRGLTVVEVEFASEEEAASFMPPHWFGDEITEDSRFRNAALALAGKPPA
jgi:CYTH domain-containing protein